MNSPLALVTKFFFSYLKISVFFKFHWFRSGFACWSLVPKWFTTLQSNIWFWAKFWSWQLWVLGPDLSSIGLKKYFPQKLEISWLNPLSPFSVKPQGFNISCGFWILFCCCCCFRLAVVVVDKRNKLTVLSHICFNTNSIDVVVLRDAVSLNKKVYEKSE